MQYKYTSSPFNDFVSRFQKSSSTAGRDQFPRWANKHCSKWRYVAFVSTLNSHFFETTLCRQRCVANVVFASRERIHQVGNRLLYTIQQSITASYPRNPQELSIYLRSRMSTLSCNNNIQLF